MVVDIKVFGEIIIWKELEFILGVMVESMKVNIKKIKSMDLEYICGKMEDATMVGGGEESNMDLDYILQQIYGNMVYGRMEKELNGLIIRKLKK